MRRSLPLAALLLVLLAPLGQAQSFERYNVATFSQAVDNPAAGALFSHAIDPTPPAAWDVSDRYVVATFTYTARVSQAGTGIWNYQVTWDGVNICRWAIETVGIAGTETVYPFHGIYCRVNAAALAGSSHTLAVTRSVLSGTPGAVQHEVLSYTFDQTALIVDQTLASLEDHREKSLELSMHDPANQFEGLGFDGFLFAVGWLLAMWIMLRRAKGFAAFTALLGFLNEWLTVMPGSRLGYILLFVLGLWLEAILGDKLWQRWLRTENTERETP